MQRRLLFLLPAAAFLAVALALFLGLGRDPSIVPSNLIGRPVPQFDLPPLLDNKPGLASADLLGDVVLVNYFASWCLPCRAEHPLLMRLAAEGTLPVYGINFKDTPEDAKRWLAEWGDPYRRIGKDHDGRVSIEWGVYGIPESFLIDRNGVILYKQVGPLTPQTLGEDLLPLVREAQQ